MREKEKRGERRKEKGERRKEKDKEKEGRERITLRRAMVRRAVLCCVSLGLSTSFFCAVHALCRARACARASACLVYHCHFSAVGNMCFSKFWLSTMLSCCLLLVAEQNE